CRSLKSSKAMIRAAITFRCRSSALKNVEDAFGHSEETEAAGRKNDRADEWLLAQGRERPFLEGTNFTDQVVEHVSAIAILVARYAKRLQFADGFGPQLFRS